MPKRSIRYFNSNVYIGPEWKIGTDYDYGGIKRLSKVQSVSLSVDVGHEEISSLGDADTYTTLHKRPRVTCSISYVLGSGRNEKILGLHTNWTFGAFAAIFASLEREIFIVSESEGQKNTTILTNALLTNYGISVSTAGLAEVTVEFEGLNMAVEAGVEDINLNRLDLRGNEIEGILISIPNETPASDTHLAESVAVRGANVDLQFLNHSLFSTLDYHFQYLNFNVEIPRADSQRMGDDLPFSRKLSGPIVVRFDTELLLTSETADKLKPHVCKTSVDALVSFGRSCEGGESFKLLVKGLRFDNLRSETSISEKKRTALIFTARCATPSSLNGNLLLKGYYGETFHEIIGVDEGGLPITQEVLYEPEEQDFEIDFKKQFSLHANTTSPWVDGSGDPQPPIYDIGGVEGLELGEVGAPIIKTWTKANKYTPYPSFVDFINNDLRQAGWEGLDIAFSIGWPEDFDEPTGNYKHPFFVKNKNKNGGEIAFSFPNPYPELSLEFAREMIQMNPKQEGHFNSLSVRAVDFKIQQGQNFRGTMKVASERVFRLYPMTLSAPEVYNITLPSSMNDKFVLWLDAYDLATSYEAAYELDNPTKAFRTYPFKRFLDKSGKNNNFWNESPEELAYILTNGLGRMGTVVMRRNSTSQNLRCQSTLSEDLSHFSIFGVLKTEENTSEDGTVFEFTNSLGSFNNGFKFFKNGNDGVFSFENVHSFTVPNSFSDGEWALHRINYDGENLRFYRNSNLVAAFPIQSGSGPISGIGTALMRRQKGQIAEFLVADECFDDEFSEKVERYLTFKWHLRSGEGFVDTDLPLDEYPDSSGLNQGWTCEPLESSIAFQVQQVNRNPTTTNTTLSADVLYSRYLDGAFTQIYNGGATGSAPGQYTIHLRVNSVTIHSLTISQSHIDAPDGSVVLDMNYSLGDYLLNFKVSLLKWGYTSEDGSGESNMNFWYQVKPIEVPIHHAGNDFEGVKGAEEMCEGTEDVWL